jgi:protein-tyrosine-phosphatase
MPKKVLFICTDNSCRSPMAENVLKKLIHDNHWTLECGSAGLAAFNGVPAAQDAVEACKEKGIDLSAHQSQPLSKALVIESDLILTMTGKHKESILRKMPELESKISLLSDYAGQGIEDVEDPVGQSFEQYQKVFAQIEGYLLKAKDKFNS